MNAPANDLLRIEEAAQDSPRRTSVVDLRRAITRATLLIFCLQGIGYVLRYVTQIALARWMRPLEYGAYTYAIAWTTTLAGFAAIGTDDALVWLIPHYRARKEWSHIRGLMVTAMIVAIGSSTGLAAVSSFAASTWNSPDSAVLSLGFWLIPLFTLMSLQGQAMRALNRPVLNQILQTMARPFLILAGTAAVFWTTSGLTAMSTLKCVVVACAVVIAIQSTVTLRTLPIEVYRNQAEYAVRRWLRTASMFAVTGWSHLALAQADVLVVGYALGAEKAGIYNVAASTSVLVFVSMAAADALAAPVAAELHTQRRHSDLQAVASRAAHASFWPGLGVACLIFGFSGFALRLFGGAFVTGRSVLLILTVAEVLFLAFGSSASMLQMTGHHKDTARIVGLAAAANIVLNIALVPRFGMVGGALATAATMLGRQLCLHHVAVRELGIDTSIVYAITHRG